MGAKFIVDRRCSVKTSLTLTGLIEAIKHRGVLRRLSEMNAAGAMPAEGDLPLEEILPDAGLPADLTLRDLQVQAARLMDHRITCRQCPSSLRGHVGGCIAYVPYPVSEGTEYLFWRTAVMTVQDELPPALSARASSLVQQVVALRATPFSDTLRRRGDLIARRPRVHTTGPFWRRRRLTSAQVLDGFFTNGLLVGDDLEQRAGFLSVALAVARAMEPAIRDEEQRLAFLEDVQPYADVLELMESALQQGYGIYVWP